MRHTHWSLQCHFSYFAFYWIYKAEGCDSSESHTLLLLQAASILKVASEKCAFHFSSSAAFEPLVKCVMMKIIIILITANDRWKLYVTANKYFICTYYILHIIIYHLAVLHSPSSNARIIMENMRTYGCCSLVYGHKLHFVITSLLFRFFAKAFLIFFSLLFFICFQTKKSCSQDSLFKSEKKEEKNTRKTKNQTMHSAH